VTVSNAERIVLPQTAVLTDDKGSYVLIVNAQNKIERRAGARLRHGGERRHHRRRRGAPRSRWWPPPARSCRKARLVKPAR
jgi:multidrug efflux pump subunit AcrA (membrane-fusion protein)